MNSELTVVPDRALNDEPVEIRLSGLRPHSVAWLRARLVDDFGREWASRAAFVADGSGVISPSSHAPTEGTYESLDPMGLFWSMSPTDGRMVGGLIKNSVAPTTVTLIAEIEGLTVAESKIERLFVAGGVERVPVRDGGLVGTLFVPAGSGPFPGVLVFTGSGGGIEEGKAALLASHGFAAFALAYFNAEGLPDNLIDIPVEYFESGLQWMASRPEVDGNRIGVTGQSRGGELVLLLASLFPAIKAVVAGVPSAVVWGGFGKGTDEMNPPPVAWTYRGKPIPAMPGARGKEDWSKFNPDEPIPLTPGFLRGMEDRRAVEMAAIPIERSQAAIMLVSGEADAMWPSAVLADMTATRLHQAGYAHPVVNLKYPNAGHSIKPPYVPTTVTAMLHPVSGGLFALGGTAEGNARANADSWSRLLAFFSEHLTT